MCLILKEEAALLFVLRSILSVDGKNPLLKRWMEITIKDFLYSTSVYIYYLLLPKVSSRLFVLLQIKVLYLQIINVIFLTHSLAHFTYRHVMILRSLI